MRFSTAEILPLATPDGFDEGTVEKVLHLVHRVPEVTSTAVRLCESSLSSRPPIRDPIGPSNRCSSTIGQSRAVPAMRRN